jgi:DNA-binding PadR family transcriptional regulator
MKHRHGDSPGRPSLNPEEPGGRRHGEHRRHHRGHGDRHGGRPFDYGELRLLVVAMLAEQPSHGYELMRAVEARMGGSYSPSPGVIYPTLSWLEDMGYALVELEAAGRKRYRLTAAGEAFLTANRVAVDAVFSRIGSAGEGGRDGAPAPIVRGMENLKLAVRLRLKQGLLSQTAVETIAAALDAAAQTVERS